MAFAGTNSTPRQLSGRVNVTDLVRYPANMRIAQAMLQIATLHSIELVDLTDHVAKVVADTGLREGWVDLWCRHTSCGLLVNENETGLRADVTTLCEELVQGHPARRWCHDDLDIRTENLVEGERPNAHSHLLTMLVSTPNLRVWVEDGRLAMGTWQRIMLAEFDGPRPDPGLTPGQEPVHPTRVVVLNLCTTALRQSSNGAIS